MDTILDSLGDFLERTGVLGLVLLGAVGFACISFIYAVMKAGSDMLAAMFAFLWFAAWFMLFIFVFVGIPLLIIAMIAKFFKWLFT